MTERLVENRPEPRVCESCEMGEHSECEEPKETRMERDTGWHHVTLCCCRDADEGFDPPEPDYDDVPPWFDRD